MLKVQSFMRVPELDVMDPSGMTIGFRSTDHTIVLFVDTDSGWAHDAVRSYEPKFEWNIEDVIFELASCGKRA